MKKILLIGAGGQVGQELQHTLADEGDVVSVDRSTLDLTHTEQIRMVIRDTSPTVVVNAAAYTAVDKAETEVDLANAVNAVAPKVMAEEAHDLGAFLIHMSTDYVFDGTKNTPYQEDDTPNPIGAYGKSKLLGEMGIQQACDRHVILRTAWVYGNRGKGNFVKTMLRLGAEREELRVVADQVGTPTWAADIARAIAHIARQVDSSASVPSGIYHFTNSGVTSWYDFATLIFEEAKQRHFPLKIHRVTPITTAEYPTPARRPAYSVLAWQKTSNLLGYSSPHWLISLRQMLNQSC